MKYQRKYLLNNCQIVIFILYLLIPNLAVSNPLTESHIESFCEDKPIWAAFDIQPKTCRQAVQVCIVKPEFKDLDPETLSEPFYLCVFEQLDIEL